MTIATLSFMLQPVTKLFRLFYIHIDIATETIMDNFTYIIILSLK